jgi:four helix bundle protein
MTGMIDKDFNKTFRFRNFPVYKDARRFSIELKKVVRERFPKEEQYALLSQISRAVDSVVLNIAEGADRSTDKDFALFINRSHTSLNEVVACLDVALDCSYVEEKEHDEYLHKASLLVHQLTAFRKSLIAEPKK